MLYGEADVVQHRTLVEGLTDVAKLEEIFRAGIHITPGLHVAFFTRKPQLRGPASVDS
jgi:hypothetical protein